MQDVWNSVDLATVNGNAVRMRTMEQFTARWHVHADSDEFFYCVSGRFYLDTEDRTIEVRAGQHFMVPAGLRHRGRAKTRTTYPGRRPHSAISTLAFRVWSNFVVFIMSRAKP